jgi:hypothetical protein
VATAPAYEPTTSARLATSGSWPVTQHSLSQEYRLCSDAPRRAGQEPDGYYDGPRRPGCHTACWPATPSRGEFIVGDPVSCGDPDVITHTETRRYGTATAQAWDLRPPEIASPIRTTTALLTGPDQMPFHTTHPAIFGVKHSGCLYGSLRRGSRLCMVLQLLGEVVGKSWARRRDDLAYVDRLSRLRVHYYGMYR